MNWRIGDRCAVLALIVVAPATTSLAQFFDGFDNLKLDPTMTLSLKLETHATMDFRQGGPGYASIFVDGTTDKRGIWWALVERGVSDNMDLTLMQKPGPGPRYPQAESAVMS